MAPKIYLETVNVILHGKKNFADEIKFKNLEMGCYSYITQDGHNCNIKCSYKREAGGNLMKEEEVANGTLEAKARGM